MFDSLEDRVTDMSKEVEASARMNHVKVTDLPECNLHRYDADTVLAKGSEYEQMMLKTDDSRSDWASYVNNLKTYVSVRSLWFSNTDFRPCPHDEGVTSVIKEATVSKNGSLVKTCDICGIRVEENIIYSPKKFILSNTKYVYSGKEKRPSVAVYDSRGKRIEPDNYSISYSNNKKAGKAKVKVSFKGKKYSGEKNIYFSIKKAPNPLAVKGKTATLKYAALKKKSKSIKVTFVLRFSGKGKGAVTYSKKAGNKKISVNSKTGKIKVRKGLKRGTYRVKLRLRAAGNSNYKASSVKEVTFAIRVK